MQTTRRVAVTGIGMISSLGVNKTECWQGLTSGRSGVGPITRFDTSQAPTRIGGQLPDAYYEIERKFFSKRLEKQTLPTTRLGYILADEALTDAGLNLMQVNPLRCAVITGSGQSDFQEGEDAKTRTEGQFVIIRQMANAISAWISIKHHFRGPTYNIATACASGAFAVAAAREYIATGRGDVSLAVGVDMMLSPESIFGFSQLQALSTRNDAPAEASRPFDKGRDGFVLANGGAALLLEDERAARERGARIYAWVDGAGICSEAYNIVAPDPTGGGMAKCMELACADAGCPLTDIGYISAHGTSTHHNDAAETGAINRLFGDHARKLAVSSQKSMTGHTIGGAGAIEAAATALSLYHGVLTPTINQESADPECNLDYVPNVAREAPALRAALSNSFGFGGHNCSILFRKV
jgi:3-oxoacyl-[acyl-carrier-protein] synthase II